MNNGDRGYVGEVREVSPVFSFEPGLTNACAKMVHVDVDWTLDENVHPEPQLEEDEFIEVFLVRKDQFLEDVKGMCELFGLFSAIAEREGAMIHGMVYTYGMGLMMAK